MCALLGGFKGITEEQRVLCNLVAHCSVIYSPVLCDLMNHLFEQLAV